MNLREAAKQALGVLETDVMQRTYAGGVRINNAAIALRAALAEPDGWRQCAVGQKETQYCGLLEEAVKAEREACARLLDTMAAQDKWSNYYEIAAEAIRAKGDDD